MTQPRHMETSTLFTKDQLAALDSSTLPHHVAIIMDGNRRWACQKSLPSLAGHWAGAQAMKNIVRSAAEMGIKVLTVYSFSTENWTRPEEEIEGLFELLEAYLREERSSMLLEGVRLQTIGDLSRFPAQLQEIIRDTKEATEMGEKIDLILALNYGGRDEIRRAIIKIVEECSLGKMSHADISESLVSKYLDTAMWRDPDLLIRTSGEMRISNFLLWQVSYAEIYHTDVLWPDFSEHHLYDAVLEYQRRERRLGS